MLQIAASHPPKVLQTGSAPPHRPSSPVWPGEAARQRLEVGDGRELVPLHRLLAEVKGLQPQRDSAQEEVLTERLSAEHAQLELTHAQSFSAVAAVDELTRRRRKVSLRPEVPERAGAGLISLTISLKVGFLVLLEIFVFRLDVLRGSGSRYVFTYGFGSAPSSDT